MTDIIKLETISPNFHVLHGAMGAKSWFSYGVLIAVKVSESSNIVWITPRFYSVTTTKHLNTIKRMADTYGFDIRTADTEDELNGWAA